MKQNLFSKLIHIQGFCTSLAIAITLDVDDWIQLLYKPPLPKVGLRFDYAKRGKFELHKRQGGGVRGYCCGGADVGGSMGASHDWVFMDAVL